MKNELTQKSETIRVCDEFKDYEVYGMKYELPSTTGCPQYRFKKITVGVENSSCLDSEILNYEHLILPVDMTHRQLRVTVHSINRNNNSYYSSEEEPFNVALYREGCQKALFCYEVKPSSPEYNLELSYSKIQPGKYHLYVSNAEPARYGFGYRGFGNGVAYRFRVLEHGTYLNMPSIRSVDHFIAPGLRVYFNEPIPPQESWLSCEYYDEDYRIVATPKWVEISSNGLYANIGVCPIGHWLPTGVYHILLYHNNQPKAQFRFERSDDRSSEIKQEPLTISIQ